MAFEDTLNLRILDLKMNCLDVLPENALKLLPGLTYLDLSYFIFNQLTVTSKEVFLRWRFYNTALKNEEQTASSPNVVLAFHDNQ